MIPLKLQIKNFVSYGPKTQVIDFEPYNFICLSGKNGHGKSALLDALTWAIWGHARKIGSTKSDDALIHLGQSNMMASLDFISNGIIYRVRRELTQSGKRAYSTLEFGIIDSQTKSFKPLTDKAIRITQEKIEKSIGLDYESFINSAFLRQGQSNEFSKKSPKDRKEILATILGLDHFEKIRKLATERAKFIVNKRDCSIGVYEQLAKDLEQKDTIISQLKEINNTIEKLQETENYYKNILTNTKKEQEALALIKSKAQQVIFEKEQLNLLIKTQTDQITQEFQKWRNIFRQRKKFIDFKKIDTEYNNLSAKLKEIQAIISTRINLKEQLISKKEEEQNYLQKLQQNFNQKLEEKKLKLQHYQISVKNIEQKILDSEQNCLQNITELKKLNTDLKNLDNNIIKENIDITNQEEQIDKRKSYFHKFTAQVNWLKTELTNLDQKLDLIEKDKKASCPLCKQNLTVDYKNNLYQKLKKQELFLKHQLNRLVKIVNILKNILTEQSKTIEKYKKQVEEEKILTIKKEELQKNIDKLKLVTNQREIDIKLFKDNLNLEIKNLNIIQAELGKLEKEFQNNLLEDKQYNIVKSEIENIEKTLSLINYNQNEEQEIYKQLQYLENIKQEQSLLLNEFTLQEQRKQNISNLCSKTKEFKKLKKEKEEEYKKFGPVITKELELQEQEQVINQKIQELLLQKERYFHQKGSIEQQNIILAQKEKEYIEQKKIINNLNQEAEEYKAIAAALSKDGIQALLIEDAIPEIEQEANILLSRLTDNQAHLMIESLKDLKSGITKETLDIKVSDPVGIRSYELFSGGEAFRIDFALRIAISKLLARRAGTALQTLIIDEGFGSQDEEGLSNIMESLYKIQHDFAKVIIVSHLSSLKEQFPVNFLIYKSAQGSLIKVIEQG